MIVLLGLSTTGAIGLSACSQSEESRQLEEDFNYHFHRCVEDPAFNERFKLRKVALELNSELNWEPITNEEIETSAYHQVFSCECVGDVIEEWGGIRDKLSFYRGAMKKIRAECINRDKLKGAHDAIEAGTFRQFPEEDWTLSLYSGDTTLIRWNYTSMKMCMDFGRLYHSDLLVERFECGQNCSKEIDLTKTLRCDRICNVSGCR